MDTENKTETTGSARSRRVSSRGIALTASGLVLTLALLCLMAYPLNAPTMGGFFPGGVPMAPATALCFVLLSGTLLLWQTSLPWKRGALKAAAALVLLVAADVLLGPPCSGAGRL